MHCWTYGIGNPDQVQFNLMTTINLKNDMALKKSNKVLYTGSSSKQENFVFCS